MKKVKKFPKSVFVYFGEENTENEYLGVSEDIEDTIDMGEKKIVAIYELKELKTISGKAVIE